MKYRPRTDENQKQIVAELRRYGASVAVLAHLGGGVPDLLVGFRGKNYLFEVKNPKVRPADRKLSDDERVFHALWSGQLATVHSTEEIISIIEH
jgi:hypothetical protein